MCLQKRRHKIRGMQEHLYLKRFSYDQFLQAYQVDRFLVDFFNDPNVQPLLQVLCSGERWGRLGKVDSIQKEELNHSITSLDFFDRLKDHGIVRKSSGDIVKCFDEYYESFLISDELRKCLLMEEFENYDIFSEQDRKEFIFHLFKGLCLGGRLCQYEDNIEPYLNTTRKIYKDLVRFVSSIVSTDY